MKDNKRVTLNSSIPLALQRILQGAHCRHIPRGQIILYEGDAPLETYILKFGAVKIYDIDEQGNEKILHIVKPPAVVPFAFFSHNQTPLRWFYTTLTDCELYILPAADLRQAFVRDGALAKVLTAEFSNDVHELLVRLSSLSKTNAQDKLSAALTFLADRHATKQQAEWRRVDFPVSHQLLADLCGITRESATMAMKELQNKKMVRNPRVTILEINCNKLMQA